MSGISLESAIRTCKVDTSWAGRVESDRFLNPSNMVCPVWNGVDTAGRSVCPDSFYTKREGCNSAEDRIMVENNVSRPQYMEYVTLGAGGIKGNIYDNTMGHANSTLRNKELEQIHDIAGQFGHDYGRNINPSCGYRPYKEAMAQKATQMRNDQSVEVGYESYNDRRHSGF